ncbi:uncharacterized protein ARMOST_16020 [Armillaria ostoyae]|uniref:Alpha-glucosidase n=1 Tax=Armillaria ostoyae TaxID=47428 RepID=A0A284RV21_ARMOS|nr:uncharacterized protein ARMOST_16020 [Armillaria ostoyae]
MQNYSLEGVQYDGIWLDMNEASSFCDGSYGTGANLTKTGVSFILPGEPGNLILDYRVMIVQAQVPVGNMTINGTSTRVVTINQALSRRGRSQYSSICHQQWIQQVALVANGTRASGAVKLDVHNLWGLIVAGASRTAIAARYSLLPYWYTLSAKASLYDTSPVLPQSPVFPDEEELLGVDRQFLIGRDVLVTPIL